MHDWNARLRGRMRLKDLSPAQQEEIVTELASHLEDLYLERRAGGLEEREAVAQALSEITDCRTLSKTIQSARREGGRMNDRTKHLWLAGLVALTGAVLMFAVSIRFNHRYIYHSRYADVLFEFPWLVTLPFPAPLELIYPHGEAGAVWRVWRAAWLHPASC